MAVLVLADRRCRSLGSPVLGDLCAPVGPTSFALGGHPPAPIASPCLKNPLVVAGAVTVNGVPIAHSGAGPPPIIEVS